MNPHISPESTPFKVCKRHARKRFTGVVAAGALVCLLGACTSATDQDHPLRGAASTVGWATTVGQPKDFVLARRQAGELSYVPIGRGGIERPVVQRDPTTVRGLESELDGERDRSEAFARRSLPSGAYGAPLPSVAAPPRAQRASSTNRRPDEPTTGAPESYPVSPGRLQQLRENARQVQ